PRFPGKVDWVGAVLLGLALVALSLGLTTSGSVGAWAGIDVLNRSASGVSPDFFTPQGIVLLVVSLAFFVAFVLWQRRASQPLVPPDLLFSRRRWPFAAANLTNLLVGGARIVTMVCVLLAVARVVPAGYLQRRRVTFSCR